MRLEKMIIVNRAPFKNLCLDFTNYNISVLSGINGTGKTTIISYIVDAIYELAQIAFENEFKNKVGQYYRISSNLYSQDASKYSIVYLRFNNENDDLDYIDIRGSFSQEEYQANITLENAIQYASLKDGISDGYLKKWSITDKKRIKRIFDSFLLTYFPAYRYELPAFLNDPYKMKLSFDKDMSFSGYLKNSIEVNTTIHEIANWIMDIVLDYRTYPEKGVLQFNQLCNLLSSIIMPKSKHSVRLGIGPRNRGAERISIINTQNNKHLYPSIFGMSSGELSLLCLFGELIMQSDRLEVSSHDISGIVLIDEIDKHLHIKLQKDVLPKLIKMFPNVQFIASSHSPFFNLGLGDEQGLSYQIIDLDNGGITCPPENNDLFREVYNMMIAKNDRYADLYNELKGNILKSTKPIIITEGKSDWKHLKAAMRELQIIDLDIEFYEFEDTMGATSLQTMLEQFARIPQARKIIGIFDRDESNIVKEFDAGDKHFVEIIPGSNVFAFLLPLVHEDIYDTTAISIEHYYCKEDLCKEDINGRRIFLGREFHGRSGNSLDGVYQTRAKQLQNKVAINGVIDEKVYRHDDIGQEHSVALTKDDFAKYIYEKNDFCNGFDLSAFACIFDIVREIVGQGEKS